MEGISAKVVYGNVNAPDDEKICEIWVRLRYYWHIVLNVDPDSKYLVLV